MSIAGIGSEKGLQHQVHWAPGARRDVIVAVPVHKGGSQQPRGSAWLEISESFSRLREGQMREHVSAENEVDGWQPIA